MPTAQPAATSTPQPTNTDTPPVPQRQRRLRTIILGAALGASFVLPIGTLQAPAVAAVESGNGCTSWASTTRPPTYIRVLRRKNGRVERVPFKKYVVTVMGKEWPSYLPQSVIEAGAVAVKQFGWYHARGRTARSARGQCYDVTDGVGDQLYKPERARVRPAHYAAASKTWNVRLLKHGQLFMTGYRRGSVGPCGRDRNGWKLYALSAKRCARNGYSYLRILRLYYGPSLQVLNGGGGSASAGDRNAQSRDSGFSGQLESRGPVPTDRRSPSRQPAIRQPASNPRPRGDRERERPAATPSATTVYRAGLIAKAGTDGLVARRGPGQGLIDLFVGGVRVARIDTTRAAIAAR